MEMLSQEVIDQRMQDIINILHTLTLPFQSIAKPFPCHDGDDTEYTTTLGGRGISVFPSAERTNNGCCNIAIINLEIWYGMKNVGGSNCHIVLDCPDEVWDACLCAVVEELKKELHRKLNEIFKNYVLLHSSSEYSRAMKLVWDTEKT